MDDWGGDNDWDMSHEEYCGDPLMEETTHGSTGDYNEVPQSALGSTSQVQIQFLPACQPQSDNRQLTEEPDAGDDTDGDEVSPMLRAFLELSCVRMAYLLAVQGNIYAKLTVKSADKILDNSLNMLAAAGALPQHPKAIRTIKSARRRLGLDPDQFITQHPICTVCWKRYSMQQINSMNAPTCTVLRCKGLVYCEKQDTDGKIKRVVSKRLPVVSLITELRKMFMHPGFATSIRDSRQDQPNWNDDPDFPMEDIYHGMMWHSSTTNSMREIGTDFSVQDTHSTGSPVKLMTHRYGLHLTANLDWYVCFPRKDS
jgi:hypothetical protein